jgi:hypothetical protein
MAIDFNGVRDDDLDDSPHARGMADASTALARSQNLLSTVSNMKSCRHEE